MKTILIKHNRGNHSDAQLKNHGTIIFEGTKKECQQELVRMRKFCKDKYHNTSTNEKLTDFVNYEMANIWMLKK
jgi:hypothetical protein